jgi:hypothetical protein
MKVRKLPLMLGVIVLCITGVSVAASIGETGLGRTIVNGEWSTNPSPSLNQREAPENDNVGNSKDDGVGNIESGDTTKMLKRKEALHLGTFGFGPAWFLNLDTDPQNYNVYAGYMFEPHPHAAIKTLINITSDFKTDVVALADLGANFYVLTSAVTPYVGGSLGLGFIRAEKENNAGFTGSGSVGLMLFRTSNVHLNLEFMTTVFLKKINDKNPVLMIARIGIAI